MAIRRAYVKRNMRENVEQETPQDPFYPLSKYVNNRKLRDWFHELSQEIVPKPTRSFYFP